MAEGGVQPGRDPRVGPDPEVDVTASVSNPELVMAIEAYLRDTSPANEEAMLLAFARGVYLVAAIFDPPLAIGPDGTAVTEVDTTISYAYYPVAEDGELALGIFSDGDALLEADPDVPSVQVLLASDAFAIALRGWAILNPGTSRSFALSPDACRVVGSLLGLVDGRG